MRYTGNSITKTVLDSVKVGDLVTINEWEQPLKVYAVSDNYFVMARRDVNQWEYSVCEKTPRFAGNHNSMIHGAFHCGPDAWIFEAPVWLKYGDGMNFDNTDAADAYCHSFEDASFNSVNGEVSEKSRISERNGVAIRTIHIERGG